MMHRRNQDPGRLRRKRIETGLNQTELAARAELSTAHMSAIESGRRGASPKVLRRLAEALECSIVDLMPPEPQPAGTEAA
jgi:transcriptional regulator with XRE-family HTH domain